MNLKEKIINEIKDNLLNYYLDKREETINKYKDLLEEDLL